MKRATSEISQILICGDVRTKEQIAFLRGAGIFCYLFPDGVAKKFLPSGYHGIVPYTPVSGSVDARALPNAINETNGFWDEKGRNTCVNEGPPVRLHPPWLLARPLDGVHIGCEAGTYYGDDEKMTASRASHGYSFKLHTDTASPYEALHPRALTRGEEKCVKKAYAWMLAKTPAWLATADAAPDFSNHVSLIVQTALAQEVKPEHMPKFNVLLASQSLLADTPPLVAYGCIDELHELKEGDISDEGKPFVEALQQLETQQIPAVAQALFDLAIKDIARGASYGNWIASKLGQEKGNIKKLLTEKFLSATLYECAKALVQNELSANRAGFNWILYRHALAAVVCALALRLQPPDADDFRYDSKSGKLLKGALSQLPSWMAGAGLHAMLADCTDDLELLTEAIQAMRDALHSKDKNKIAKATRHLGAAIFVHRLDVPELTVGALVYQEGPEPSKYWEMHEYNRLAQSIGEEGLTKLKECVVSGTARRWTSVSDREALIHVDSLIINQFQQRAFEAGYVGIGYFAPVYVLGWFFPNSSARTIQAALEAWLNTQLMARTQFSARYSEDYAAQFAHAGRMPRDGHIIVRNNMWHLFCSHFAKSAKKITGMKIQEKNDMLLLYAFAYQRYSTALMGRDEVCVAEHLRDMGLAMEDDIGLERYMVCLDAIFCGEAKPDGKGGVLCWQDDDSKSADENYKASRGNSIKNLLTGKGDLKDKANALKASKTASELQRELVSQKQRRHKERKIRTAQRKNVKRKAKRKQAQEDVSFTCDG